MRGSGVVLPDPPDTRYRGFSPTTPLMEKRTTSFICDFLVRAVTALARSRTNPHAAEDIRQANTFLNALANGNLETVRRALAPGFTACEPTFVGTQSLETFLNAWVLHRRQVAREHFQVVTAAAVLVTESDHPGVWVYQQGTWTTSDQNLAYPSRPLPFRHMARLIDGKIAQTYTSYGADPLFDDLILPLFDFEPEAAAPAHHAW